MQTILLFTAETFGLFTFPWFGVFFTVSAVAIPVVITLTVRDAFRGPKTTNS